MSTLAVRNGNKPTLTAAQDAVRTLMAYCGYTTDQPGTQDTPRRVVDALEEMTAGQHDDPGEYLCRQFEPQDSDHDEMIAMTGIEFVAVCEHHLMPFTGTATVAYVPHVGGPVVGISKLARLVDVYARRLTMQERMTRQITTALDEHLQSRGSACIIRSVHSCMSMRGVCQRSAVTITSSLTGVLRDDPRAREELMFITAGDHHG
jgi:GTP cyclohydrolase I